MGKKTTYVINVGKNNYHKNPKKSSIETPIELSLFIYDLLKDHKWKTVWDIGCGRGVLSYPFYQNKFKCVGHDIAKYTYHSEFIQSNFFSEGTILDSNNDDLILCNPPFNYQKGTPPSYATKYAKEAGFMKKPLFPQLFLHKIFSIWGPKAQVILFTTMGFLRNQRKLDNNKFSERHEWLRKLYANGTRITSIISVPMNIFPGVIVHSDILIWNIKGLHPHYVYHEDNFKYGR